MNRRPVLAAALVLWSSGVWAQTPPQPPPPVFRTGVDLIEVDVSVVDNRGRPITDMRGPEFTVTVNGQPRTIVSAHFVTMRPPKTDGRRALRDTPDAPFTSNTTAVPGRLVVIAVDRDNISFGGGREVVPAAKKFLDALGPNDKVAFLTVPLGPQVGFTANHRLIRAELDRVIGVARRPRLDLNIGVAEAFAIAEHSDPRVEAEVLLRFCGRLRGMEAEACELNVRTQAGAIAHEQHVRTDAAVHTLEALLQMLRDIDGPKSVVWISEGLVTSRGGNELSGLERLADAARATINVIMLDEPIINVAEAEKSPTSRDDRELAVVGLELLAGRTRGALYRVSVNAEAAFTQMEETLSGYYLLGVEPTAADRDGKRHPIKVTVRRQGASVRARREFQFANTGAAAVESPEKRIERALSAPFSTSELPMRVATYAYQDANSPRVRVLVATEIDGRDAASGTVTIGYALIDQEGRIAATGVQRKTLAAAQGPDGPTFEDAGAFVVDPGSYILKLAVIDANGRRGSVEHPLQAFQMAGVPFAVGDLMLADNPVRAADSIRPPVEARIATGRLATYMELYAADPASFAAMGVRIEVAAGESGAALISGDGALSGPGDARTRTVGAVVPVGALPPGQYVARAIVTRGDQQIGQLSRPFHITAASSAAGVSGAAPAGGGAPAAGSAASPSGLLAAMLPAPAAFRREDTLTSDTLGFFMDVLDKGRPALKATTARVRTGNLAGAGRAAFEADDQLAAMFLRGLELYAAGQLTQAATQFSGALRMAPDFAPATFYLGACYAAGGRDQEAVAVWRKGLADPKSVTAYRTLSDALFRLRDAEQAGALLAQASAAFPQDDPLRLRLATAHALALKHRDALAAIEPYLSRHPDQDEALLIALHAIYAAHVAGQPILTGTEERERMDKYSRAYTAARGRHTDLVRTWASYIAKSEK